MFVMNLNEFVVVYFVALFIIKGLMFVMKVNDFFVFVVLGRQHDLSSPSHPSAVAAAAAAAAARSGFLTHFYANDARSPFHRNSSGQFSFY